jgi:hypothetical protein
MDVVLRASRRVIRRRSAAAPAELMAENSPPELVLPTARWLVQLAR